MMENNQFDHQQKRKSETDFRRQQDKLMNAVRKLKEEFQPEKYMSKKELVFRNQNYDLHQVIPSS